MPSWTSFLAGRADSPCEPFRAWASSAPVGTLVHARPHGMLSVLGLENATDTDLVLSHRGCRQGEAKHGPSRKASGNTYCGTVLFPFGTDGESRLAAGKCRKTYISMFLCAAKNILMYVFQAPGNQRRGAGARALCPLGCTEARRMLIPLALCWVMSVQHALPIVWQAKPRPH